MSVTNKCNMIKLVTFVCLFAVCFAAVHKRQAQYYKQPTTYQDSAHSAILRLENENYPDGSYHYAYDTENGISAQESGQLRGSGENVAVAAEGSFQYTSPEGVPVGVQYTADENGFHPVGALLPTPPPIPPAIARSLEYIAAHPEPQQQIYNTVQPQYYTTPRPYRRF